jgi:hypothetical protein
MAVPDSKLALTLALAVGWLRNPFKRSPWACYRDSYLLRLHGIAVFIAGIPYPGEAFLKTSFPLSW